MAVNIGDKISFLNEDLKGEVTSIQANGMIGVTIEDGFELSVSAREVVVTESVVGSSGAVPSRMEALPPKQDFDAKAGLYWMLCSTELGFDLKLLNNLVYPVLFACYRKNLNSIEMINSGRLEAGALVNIAESKSRELGRLGVFSTQIIPLRQFPSVVPVPVTASLDTTEISPGTEAGKTGDKPFFLFAFNAEKPKVEVPEKKPEIIPVNLNNVSKPTEVIDLHANALGLDSLHGDEILKKQMEHFHRSLELGLAYNLPGMTFIHGAGSGVLKNLIALALKGNKHIARVAEADEQKYGYGATEVVFRL